MSPMERELRMTGAKLLASPGAVFLAVLTAGLATASLGHHTGMFRANAGAVRRSSVVLACPRSGAQAHSRAAGAGPSASASWQQNSASASNSAAESSSAGTANAGDSTEKRPGGQNGKSASIEFSVPLPDFSAPELSRFTSPL